MPSRIATDRGAPAWRCSATPVHDVDEDAVADSLQQLEGGVEERDEQHLSDVSSRADVARTLERAERVA